MPLEAAGLHKLCDGMSPDSTGAPAPTHAHPSPRVESRTWARDSDTLLTPACPSPRGTDLGPQAVFLAPRD